MENYLFITNVKEEHILLFILIKNLYLPYNKMVK